MQQTELYISHRTESLKEKSSCCLTVTSIPGSV